MLTAGPRVDLRLVGLLGLEVDEKLEDASFDGEWEVVEEAFSEYDLRHNWFVSIRARKGHVQHA